MTDEKIHKLVRTANQIADNFRMLPEKESVTGVADHLRLYWTPKMIGELVAYADAERSGFIHVSGHFSGSGGVPANLSSTSRNLPFNALSSSENCNRPWLR